MTALTTHQREKVIADLRTVVSDAEALLKLTAGEVGERSVGLRERLQERLSLARHRLLSLQATAMDGAKSAAYAADDHVHDHPWQSIALGTGIGMLVGLLIGRRA